MRTPGIRRNMKPNSELVLSFPFHCPISLKRLTREEFDVISAIVMSHVFASQKDLGRLCDEQVFQRDITHRLEAAGLGPVAREVPVSVSLHDFTKTYYLDLVVQEAFIAELKCVEALASEHLVQLLNYLLITEASHGKLINLRPPSVEFRTVNGAVSKEERRQYAIRTEKWQPQTSRCALLADIVDEILRAWGAFLDCHLYEEALVYFLGGKDRVLHPVALERAGFLLGSQRMPLLTEAVGFRCTALAPEAQGGYELHLRRLLALTPLQALHWVNMHRHEIWLMTITR